MLRVAKVSPLWVCAGIIGSLLSAHAQPAQHDPQARACLGEIMRDGWRRAWQMVSTGESITVFGAVADSRALLDWLRTQ